MNRILVLIFVACNLVLITKGQHFYHIQNKPSQNDYSHLSEIPFESAVRAVTTPQRDHIPIHEAQQDIPPPPKPQPVQNQQPQQYSNSAPLILAGQFPTNQGNHFQYMIIEENPNEIYSFLYQTPAEKAGINRNVANNVIFRNFIPQPSNIQPNYVPEYQPLYQNIKPSFNNFKPSPAFNQNHFLDQFRPTKYQYVNNYIPKGFNQNPFAPIRSARMAALPQGYRKNFRYE